MMSSILSRYLWDHERQANDHAASGSVKARTTQARLDEYPTDLIYERGHTRRRAACGPFGRCSGGRLIPGSEPRKAARDRACNTELSQHPLFDNAL